MMRGKHMATMFVEDPELDLKAYTRIAPDMITIVFVVMVKPSAHAHM
jgi:hypothetical protein